MRSTRAVPIASLLCLRGRLRALHLAQPLCADRCCCDASYLAPLEEREQSPRDYPAWQPLAARRRRAAMGLVHERLLNATYWKEVVGDAPEEGVDPLILKLFAGVMLLWVLFGPCLTYAVELSGRRRKRLKID